MEIDMDTIGDGRPPRRADNAPPMTVELKPSPSLNRLSGAIRRRQFVPAIFRIFPGATVAPPMKPTQRTWCDPLCHDDDPAAPRSSCRSVSRPRIARLPHDLEAAIEAGISMAPDMMGRRASRPLHLLLALAIEAEWRKRAAGVVPAQPKAQPEGQCHQFVLCH